jgi:Ca2+-binding RTX toxin-like protein
MKHLTPKAAVAADLVGTNGNDFLDGGAGHQAVSGGAGADTFVMRTGGGQDWVTDFNPAAGDRVLFDEYHSFSNILYLGQLYDGLVINNFNGGHFTIHAADVNGDGVMDTVVAADNGDSMVLLGWAPELLYGWALMGG